MVYFPKEIFRIIYSYDCTYKKIYDDCLQEMSSKFNLNRCICLLNSLFYNTHYGTHLAYHQIYSKNTLAQYTKNHAKKHKDYNFSNILHHYRHIYEKITCCIYCRGKKGKLYVRNYK